MKANLSSHLSVLVLVVFVVSLSAVAMHAQKLMDPATTFKTLFSFNGTDGSLPYYMTLIQGTDGEFYGTTSTGGAHNNDGTVFKITSSGKLTTLYNFCAQASCADGANPWAGLIQASDGNFYGTTNGGGAYGKGTVFLSR